MVKDSEPYKDIGNNVGQATLRLLDKNWKSFFEAIKDWNKNKGKYLGRPKLPKYKKKDGRFILALDNNKVKLKDGYLYFCWKPFKKYNNMFRTNVKGRLVQCRFIPRGNNYVMEIVYEIKVLEVKDNPKNVASIDIGVENFITMVNNIGKKPIIVKGGIIKSINQYYNKEKAKLQSELQKKNRKYNSKRLNGLSFKRYEKIKYQMHCISRKIIDWCVKNDIDTLIIGHNNKWKQDVKHIQNFTYIPYDVFIKMLEYKCEDVGIRFIITEENYTSGTSFLDGELPIKENYDKSRRVHRGLFISDKGKRINADVNAAYQIMKKVFPNVFTNGIEDAGSHPILLNVV